MTPALQIQIALTGDRGEHGIDLDPIPRADAVLILSGRQLESCLRQFERIDAQIGRRETGQSDRRRQFDFAIAYLQRRLLDPLPRPLRPDPGVGQPGLLEQRQKPPLPPSGGHRTGRELRAQNGRHAMNEQLVQRGVAVAGPAVPFVHLEQEVGDGR